MVKSKTNRTLQYGLVVLLIFISGIFLRLYNFQSRMIFGPEQAISLITSATYLDKFSLLGEVNVQRATSTGLNPFHGAYFNYFLVPFILLFQYNPIPISYVFVFLNLLTAYIFYRVTRKLFGGEVGIFSLFYFLFNAKMIHHSLFIWNLNFLPLLGIAALYVLMNQSRGEQKASNPFWLGVISGIGFGLQYLFFPFIVLLFILTIYFSKERIKALLVFSIGALLGCLSMVLFDLRHDFYYLRTLWQYFVDVVNHRISGGIHYYDFMYLLPFLFLLYAIVTAYLYRVYKPLCVIPLVIFAWVNLRSPLVDFRKSTGVVSGINVRTLENASSAIASDKPPAKYNVATLWDFDTRAHTLRYFLTYYFHLKPQPVEDYKDVDALYAFAPKDYNIYEPAVYELEAFLPYKVRVLPTDTPGFILYKLTK